MSPKLDSHLTQLQMTALQLECVMELLNAVICEPDLGYLQLTLIETAEGMAKKINRGLDITTIRGLEA